MVGICSRHIRDATLTQRIKGYSRWYCQIIARDVPVADQAMNNIWFEEGQNLENQARDLVVVGSTLGVEHHRLSVQPRDAFCRLHKLAFYRFAGSWSVALLLYI